MRVRCQAQLLSVVWLCYQSHKHMVALRYLIDDT
jgi:hypothetical protein